MTKTQIGGYEFNYEINRIRQSTLAIGETLLKIVEGNPGPQTLSTMHLKIAIHNQTIIDALTKVETIGANEKEKRKP